MKKAMCPKCGFVENYNDAQIKLDLFFGMCNKCGYNFNIIGYEPQVNRRKIEIKETKTK